MGAGTRGAARAGAPLQDWLGGNRLLASLTPADLARLLPHLEALMLPVGHRLGETGEDMPWVFFPCEAAIVALVATCEDGRTAEAISVGRDGMLGPDLLRLTGFGQVVVQMPGQVLRLPADTLAAIAAGSTTLREALAVHARALTLRIVQAAVCAVLHPVEARASRWLLLAQDRVGHPDLPVTQEMLAEMLGVRRTTITRVMAQLGDRGLIRHRRSRVTVVDRPGLEEAACYCHRSLLQRLQGIAPMLYPG